MTRAAVTGQGPGVHGHGWKEDKVACLHVLEGPCFTADPHPQPPACFLDPAYVDRLVRDFGAGRGLPPAEEVAAAAGPAAAGAVASAAAGPAATAGPLSPAGPGRPAAAGAEAPPAPGAAAAATAGGALTDIGMSLTAGHGPPAAPAAAGAAVTPAPACLIDIPMSVSPAPGTPPGPPADVAGAAAPTWPPERVARTCVAGMCDSAEFAKAVAQEAYARGFLAADRRAFLGDGQQSNWSMQQKWFKDFVPITDFIHPLTYLYQTALALAADAAAGWPLYVGWLTA